MVFGRKKLGCGHVFHGRCVKLALKSRKDCPLCSTAVFNEHETKLLDRKVDLDTKKIDADRALIVLREAIRRDASPELIRKILANYDPSRLVYDYIAEKNAASLATVISSRMLNWHSTVRDKTIVETALDSANDDVINVVLEAASTKRLYPRL